MFQVSRSTLRRWEEAEQAEVQYFSSVLTAKPPPIDASVCHQQIPAARLFDEGHGSTAPEGEDANREVGDLPHSSSSSGITTISSESSRQDNEGALMNLDSDENVGYSADSDIIHDSDDSNSGDEGSSNDSLFTNLYENSAVSADEAILGLMDLYIQGHWTKKSLGKTLEYVRSLLPEPNELPSSLHSMLQYVQGLAPPPKVIKHDYCTDCHMLRVDNMNSCIAEDCPSESFKTFFEIDLESQIRFYFENRNLADAIDSYSTQESPEGVIKDVTDGSKFKEIRLQLNGKYDIILIWNTDGVKLVKASKMKLWPILCTISQVPPHLRSTYMIIAGVWCDSSDPTMNDFLKPFTNSLQKLDENGGVAWTHPQSKCQHKSRVAAPVLCADAPAKAEVLQMKYFSARYGCNVCEQKSVRLDLNPVGVEIPQGKRKRKVRAFIFQENDAKLRTKERVQYQANVAKEKNESHKGVIGDAVVSDIPYFDRATSICAEYLHNLMLGVVTYFTNLMFNEKGPWYIGDKIEQVNEFLVNIKVPDFVNRCPRDLSLLQYWHGNEFRAWLLYYSLPALKGILPDEYYQHWILLVGASFILLKDDISRRDLETANVMLRCFLRQVGHLYSWKNYTYNVHNLLHLALLVERWGPMSCTSAFIFEDYNNVLANLLHGTKHLGQELVNNITIASGVQILRNRVRGFKIFERIHVECESVHGKAVDPTLVDSDLAALAEFDIRLLKFFKRAKLNNIVYTCRDYDEHKRKANSYVKFIHASRVQYGQIKYFAKTPQSKIYCLVASLSVVQTDLIFYSQSQYILRHLVPVEETDKVVLVPFSVVGIKMIKAGKYLCVRPNEFEVNL